jgi:hypothetical protein
MSLHEVHQIQDTEYELVEVDEDYYKALLYQVYSNLQKIRDVLNRNDELTDEA